MLAGAARENHLFGNEIMDAQRVIDESRPMLEEFLSEVGLHRAGCPLDFPRLLEPFSNWVAAQEVIEENRFYLSRTAECF
jgi:hypothetical protein